VARAPRDGGQEAREALLHAVDGKSVGSAKQLPEQEYGPGLHRLYIGPEDVTGIKGDDAVAARPCRRTSRLYMLNVPGRLNSILPLPLWIFAPGKNPDIRHSYQDWGGMVRQHPAVVVVLSGLWEPLRKDGEWSPCLYPNDFQYVRGILRDTTQKLNIDRRRIHCIGFAEGARFCSELASGLSSFVTALSLINGIEYLKANNATQPVSVIAFHAKRVQSMVNHKDEGLPAATKWAQYNSCNKHKWKTLNPEIVLSRFFQCAGNAEVDFYEINSGENEMPDSRLIDIPTATWEFFQDHPATLPCHTAIAGEKCYEYVTWAMRYGIVEQPQWYPGINSDSSFIEYQTVAHKQVYADCYRPCPPQVKIDDTPKKSHGRFLELKVPVWWLWCGGGLILLVSSSSVGAAFLWLERRNGRSGGYSSKAADGEDA
jgi:poly(3-hydroxybutyrate) depolymerase